MIRFRLLGSLDLRRSGAEIRSVLAQPKRTALLACLAVDSLGGFQRRESLLALFWPDLDEARARNALSKAVHHLRSSLGPDVLLSRGEAELGLDPEAFWCDVAAFRDALRRGRAEEALVLYRGDLLEGFHLSAAPDFERWLEAERVRLRQQAALASGTLAEERARERDLLAATRWARHALALEPHDEVALRRLLNILDRAGDRAGAVAAYEAFAQRFATEYEIEPAPETEALIEGIRARDRPVAGWPGGAVEGVAAESDRREVVVAALLGDANRGAAVTTASRARRWTAWSGAAALGLAGLAAAFAFLPSDPRPSLAERRLLVAAFENRTGDPELDLLGHMAADLVTRSLQQTGLADLVDPASALLTARTVISDSTHLAGRARALAMAREAGAGAVVWGAVYRQRDSLHFHTQVTDVESGRVLLALEPVSTRDTDPLDGVERLQARLAGGFAAMVDERLASISARTSRPPTFEAYREYVLGLDWFVRNRAAHALPHFERAARLDTMFALPLIWSAFAYGNDGLDRQKRDSVVRVLARMRAGLAPLDQHALDYFLAENTRDKFAAARAAARLSPGSNWSHNAGQLALALNRPREAITWLRQVDPERGWAQGWWPYWKALTNAYHLIGDHAAELAAGRRARSLARDDLWHRYFELRALVGLGELAEVERSLADALRLPPGSGPGGELIAAIAVELRRHGHEEAARKAFDEAIAWYDSPGAGAWIRSQPDPERARLRVLDYQARTLYAAGHLDEARRLVQEILARDPRHEPARIHLGLIAARQGERAEAERAIRRLEEGKVTPNGVGRLPPWLPSLGQAQIAAALGDYGRAIDYLKEWLRTGGSFDGLLMIHRDADWDALRDLPTFQELLRPKN